LDDDLDKQAEAEALPSRVAPRIPTLSRSAASPLSRIEILRADVAF
jgi:hypothetical protein